MSYRFASFLLLLALATGCRTGHLEANTSSDESSSKSASDKTSKRRAEAPDPVAALAQAKVHVDSAQLLAQPIAPLESRVMQGFALPLYAELPGLGYEQMLSSVRAAGGSHVSIVVSWDQRTIYANTLRPNPDKHPSDDRVGEVIEAARAEGLEVMLFPIIHVKLRNTGEWRGKLAPEDPERWRQEYRDFILHYARLAQRHEVAIYSVGSELGSMERDEEFWRGLIAQTREIFDGKLIYSANWDHYTVAPFWDDLDYIGVSSYFEIAKDEDDSIDEMTERWRGFRDEMLGFAKEKKRPIILTEIGYPSVDSAATKPWDYTGKSDPNVNQQLAAFLATGRTWTLEGPDAELLSGVFVWHAWGAGGDSDTTYTVWDKPAEDYLERWYSR